jgi:hypothetical protein
MATYAAGRRERFEPADLVGRAAARVGHYSRLTYPRLDIYCGLKYYYS